METIIKDYGSITIPEKWEQVTLGQFERIMSIIKGEEENTSINVVKLLAILTDTDEEYINSLPAEFVESLMARLVFLNDDPTKDSDKMATSQICIDGEFYHINYMEQMKFGEYVQVNEVTKANPLDYSSILAILCRKKDEPFDDDFAANQFQKRKEMFSKRPVTDIIPLIAFFLRLYLVSQKLSKAYLTELVSQTSQLLKDTGISVKNGAGRKRSLSWRMRTLLKLRKYNKIMSRMSSSTSHT